MSELKSTLQENIAQQREVLIWLLQDPLRKVAEQCSLVWQQREQLDQVLQTALPTVPHCKYLYALDTNGQQVSSNASREGLITSDYGRDRSDRPYMSEVVPSTDFILSGAYISLRAKRPSLTAIQIVRDANNKAQGFIGADFDLRDLPLTRELYEEPRYWRQIKGDPSIRGTVFHQTRVESIMDRHFDTIMSVVEELMIDHGVFHVILHFSSSRSIMWLMDDPYRYRLLDTDILIDPNSCLAYPRRAYSPEALVKPEQIRAVLEGFKQLRFMDEMFYLRSGTLNIFNGLVGLTFSCDGSHYIPFDEFLNKDHAFWMIRAQSNR